MRHRGTTAGGPPRRSGTSRWAVAVGWGLLVLLPLAAVALGWRWIGIEHPGGSDPSFWGLEALSLRAGAEVNLPPVFPALVAAVYGVRGELVPSSMVVAGFWVGVLPALTVLLARRLGAGMVAAVLAGLACAAHGQVTVLAYKLQPDSLDVAWFTLGALTSAAVLRRPGPLAVASLVAVAGLAPLVREQALLLSVTLAGVAVLAPGPLWMRAGRLVLVAGAVLLAPVLFGQDHLLPWEAPWFERIGIAVGDLARSTRPQYFGQLDEQQSAVLQRAFEEGSRVRVALFHARHALSRSPSIWLWTGLGFASLPFLRGRLRWAPLAVLGPACSALVVWSEPRHAVIAVPTAVAAWAVALSRPGWTRRGAAVAGLCAAGLALHESGRVYHDVRQQARHVEALAGFGHALCEQVKPGDLAGGRSRPLLFCPLPFHYPPLEPVGTAWRTWFVGDTPQGRGWKQVDIGNDLHPVYRLLPELTGERRPCRESRVVTPLPYRDGPWKDVVLEPPCEENPPEVQALLEDTPELEGAVKAGGRGGPRPHPDGETRPGRGRTHPRDEPPERKPPPEGGNPPPWELPP